MSKHLRKNFSIIKPELQDLIDKKKGKKIKIATKVRSFNNNVWWRKVFRWIFFRRR